MAKHDKEPSALLDNHRRRSNEGNNLLKFVKAFIAALLLFSPTEVREKKVDRV